MVTNLVYLIFIIIRRPFSRKSDNFRVIITEVFTAIGIALKFTMMEDTSEDEPSRYDETFMIIICFFIALAIHDLFLIFDTIMGVLGYFRKKKEEKEEYRQVY